MLFLHKAIRDCFRNKSADHVVTIEEKVYFKWRMALERMVLERMALERMALERMALERMALAKVIVKILCCRTARQLQQLRQLR